MKVFTLAPGEDWICDRFVQEFNQYNPDIAITNPYEADVLWLLADWCWDQIPQKLLSKPVILSVHHITPSKFDEIEKSKFVHRDQYVNAYHVPCEKTAAQIRNLTDKPIHVQSFWVNQDLWYDSYERGSDIRKKLKIPQNVKLIGSFQRDTEGYDLKSPKLEKGPDVFCDVVERLAEIENVEVLLGGWRRQYVMERLDNAGIKYHFKDRSSFITLNSMYNALDLYVVGARFEGGPQAIVECASSKTPIISTDVGVATVFLPESSIFDPNDLSFLSKFPTPDVEKPYENVKGYMIPRGFSWFRDLIKAHRKSYH